MGFLLTLAAIGLLAAGLAVVRFHLSEERNVKVWPKRAYRLTMYLLPQGVETQSNIATSHSQWTSLPSLSLQKKVSSCTLGNIVSVEILTRKLRQEITFKL